MTDDELETRIGPLITRVLTENMSLETAIDSLTGVHGVYTLDIILVVKHVFGLGLSDAMGAVERRHAETGYDERSALRAQRQAIGTFVVGCANVVSDGSLPARVSPLCQRGDDWFIADGDGLAPADAEWIKVRLADGDARLAPTPIRAWIPNLILVDLGGGQFECGPPSEVAPKVCAAGRARLGGVPELVAQGELNRALEAAGYAARACPHNPLPVLVMIAVAEQLDPELVDWYLDEPVLTRGGLRAAVHQARRSPFAALANLIDRSPRVSEYIRRKETP